MAIRVDASAQIGTGHFMRCLTLANALTQCGARIQFISRCLPAYLQEMLTAKGHKFVLLDSCSDGALVGDLAHSAWLGTSQHGDAQASIQALSGQRWDWLVVDHYALDVRWETALRQAANNILVIDDIADRQHDCDVLLDQNYYTDMETRYIGKVPAHCRLLLGPHYALLRDEFHQLREQIKPRTGPVRRLLVFFGGVDADNFTGRTIDALSSLGVEGLHVDVVIGAQHPYRKRFESACAAHRFALHVQTSRMAELMAAADLAIGAGGSATWERCCLGVPTIAVATASNQVKQLVDAACEGFLYAPEVKYELIDVLKRHLSALLENCYLRRAISRNAMQVVDGRGILRVIQILGCSGITIRVASQEDSEHLFKWRNHPTVRGVSRNSRVIDWEEHQKWLASVLMSPHRSLLIGQREGVPVGVVRFDVKNDEAEVSIYIVPGVNEPGMGRYLLQSAESWLVANWPNLNKLRAHALGGNARSQRLFLGGGYQVESTCYLKRLH
ncbi:MAG: UDP-2,4-diacetamido-2,4,6-trideoxy-beta-L-altropyranose hydrolase [Propionivibrio sp.]|nr:UDP-2,4-diacetamido-2,4,6-trideoxy-beta-L-altropyranose hydrolase [Propionivibrio sp.]